jgi:ankyrin repeat protein
LLVEKGADVNHVARDIKMSPLHWAAFTGDELLVTKLLLHKAKFTVSVHNHNPIDIAGLCRHGTVVDTLTAHLMSECPPPDALEVENALKEIEQCNTENANSLGRTPTN